VARAGVIDEEELVAPGGDQLPGLAGVWGEF
jgi:hypothetical protein